MIINEFISEAVELIPGLAQEARPRGEWPYQPDWIVSRLALDTGNRCYWVQGHLRSGEPFFWGHYSDEVFDWRYDLTGAKLEIGRHETPAEAQRRVFGH